MGFLEFLALDSITGVILSLCMLLISAGIGYAMYAQPEWIRDITHIAWGIGEGVNNVTYPAKGMGLAFASFGTAMENWSQPSQITGGGIDATNASSDQLDAFARLMMATKVTSISVADGGPIFHMLTA